jgi:uncharacterized membrane-anchored protein YhcB (DUF1043 family)
LIAAGNKKFQILNNELVSKQKDYDTQMKELQKHYDLTFNTLVEEREQHRKDIAHLSERLRMTANKKATRWGLEIKIGAVE